MNAFDSADLFFSLNKIFEGMAMNHQTVGRSLLPNSIERDRDALVTIRQLERR